MIAQWQQLTAWQQLDKSILAVWQQIVTACELVIYEKKKFFVKTLNLNKSIGDRLEFYGHSMAVDQAHSKLLKFVANVEER